MSACLPTLRLLAFAIAVSAAEASAPGVSAEAVAHEDYAFAHTLEDIRFFYEEIYEPFYEVENAPGGRREWVTRRGRTQPSEFAAEKSSDTARIFVVGESVGLRFMEMELGPIPGALSKGWESFLPGARVEAVNAAVGSYDSARALLVFEQVLEHEPDLVVVMSGNNENWDPAGDPSALKKFASRYIFPSKRLRAFRESLSRKGLGRPKLRTVAETRALYAGNIRSMLRLAKKAGVPVAVCTLPRNHAYPPAETLPLQEEDFRESWRRLERGEYAAAENGFAAYSARRPEDAFGPFALASALLGAGRTDEARSAFAEALERSSSGSRPSFNAELRRIVREEGGILVDLESEFAKAAPGGIPGPEMFDDDVHWHRGLNPFILRRIARAVAADPAARLNGRSWDAGALLKEPADPLATDAAELKDRAERALLNGIWIWNPDPQRISERGVAAFANVRRWGPNLLDGLILPEAIERLRVRLRSNEWTAGKLGRLERVWPQVLDSLGEMHRRAGEREKAAAAFARVLELEPERPLTRLRLALCLSARGDAAGARAEFARAKTRAEEFPELRAYEKDFLMSP